MQRKGNYITFRGLSEIINEYLNVIIDKKDNFANCILKKYHCIGILKNLEFSYNKEKLILDNEYQSKLVINCKDIPEIVYGDVDKFNILKEEIYKFVFALKSYEKFLNIVYETMPIAITDDITLGIDCSDILNYIISDNEIKFSIYLKFGNKSLLECQYKNNEVNILTYSENLEFSKYLKEDKQNLYNGIFIDENKVSELLSIIES